MADILRFYEMQFHFYADDTQLCISFSTNNDVRTLAVCLHRKSRDTTRESWRSEGELTNSITKIEECLSDVDKWMSINRLKLNKDKTELFYLFSK